MFQPVFSVVPSCFHSFYYFDGFVYFTLKDMVEEAEPGQGHVGTFPSSPENDFEKLECQEPTTPRPSAPIEQISQFSPDGNHEKQEQPSPVSVLDVFFHEDVDSTDTENMIQCKLMNSLKIKLAISINIEKMSVLKI